MSYRGRIENGVVGLEPGANLREGMDVRADPVPESQSTAAEGGSTGEVQNWGDVFKYLIGAVDGLPKDLAENLSRQDHRHAAVEALYSSREPLVTTGWMLTELADGLCAAQSRAAFVTLEQRLRQNPRVTIVTPDERLYEAGLELYRQRPDKDWWLTNCFSFVAMRERGIEEAFTGDRQKIRAATVRER